MATLRVTALALLLGGTFLPVGPAHAGESFDNCTGYIDVLPATLATQGTWCLRKDVSTGIASGNAITIAANNIAIDCNHFKIGGLSAGDTTLTTGIAASNRLNVMVRNCNIRGFRAGVVALGGGGHVIEDNRFDGNTYHAISTGSAAGITIRRNEVFDTGGATVSATVATGIGVGDATSCNITDNSVYGVAPLANGAEGSYPVGIQVDCAGAEIRGNRVGGMVVEGEGRANGIRSFAAGVRIVDNFVHGSAMGTIGTGISGEGTLTICQRNVVTGMEFGIEYCETDANIVLVPDA